MNNNYYNSLNEIYGIVKSFVNKYVDNKSFKTKSELTIYCMDMLKMEKDIHMKLLRDYEFKIKEKLKPKGKFDAYLNAWKEYQVYERFNEFVHSSSYPKERNAETIVKWEKDNNIVSFKFYCKLKGLEQDYDDWINPDKYKR
jgi:hypothetical protein